jgi:Protein of unknown function (DUF2510)
VSEQPPREYVPPGWFPDPTGLQALRWWDGTQWSQQTRPLPGNEQEPQLPYQQQSYSQPNQPSSAPDRQHGTPPGPPPYQDHLQYQGTPYEQPYPQAHSYSHQPGPPSGHHGPPRKSWPPRHKVLTALGGLIALIIIGSIATAAGGGNHASPTGTAAALLAKAGATSSGPAYTVTSSDADAVCNNGAAEADGAVQLHGGWSDTVNACVFPSNDQLESDLQAGQFPADSDVIQVGQTELVFVSGNSSDNSASGILTGAEESAAGGAQIASKVGGTVIPDSDLP